ncbi:hypothetical protein PPERSA_05762 [Pseudocohnilembus persalinus]|uniref:Uncharacterized protein n=1 Tax=Pseudocohnilembus persalinus TaxID=266149 RepID=A0A0V0QI11_PSEPJ|nr:hypothetical protein PPERSA_05762 [Pseudocohnilembus persalinus]|eukprot:KRX01923.1 hypothetical protein PPERSA_05762 [Pseudocohnilembus persalinus]
MNHLLIHNLFDSQINRIIKKIQIKQNQQKKKNLKFLNYQIYIKYININCQKYLSDIDKYLFTEEQMKKGEITIKECEETLKRDPFNLNNQQDIMETARYLIEDNNTEGFIDYDPEASERIPVVRSVFKALVGHYKPFSDQKELMEKLSQVIVQQQWQSQTLDYLLKKQQNKKKGKQGEGNICSMEDMEGFIQSFDVTQWLNKRQIEFFFYKLFQTTNDIERVDIDKFYAQFKWDEQQQQEE